MSGRVTVTQEGAFDSVVRQQVNGMLSQLYGGVLLNQGRLIYLAPATGNDSSDGTDPSSAYKTLSAAYGVATAGKNDTIVLLGDGSTTGTARVEASFTWAKNATHLIGVCAPVLFSQRARIAPTGSTTAFTPFFTISASGCIFQNLSWFYGFTTGTATEILLVLTGSRNYFSRCQFAGMADTDAASAAGAGSRILKIGLAGSGENLFEDCVVGVDTITRSAANASVEFTAATVRNTFRRCYFPFMTSASSPLGILGTGNECCDRAQFFEDCIFANAIKSTSTQMTVLGSFTTASPGGMVIFKRCAMVGVTKFGDTNFLANSYIDMPAVDGAAGGLMVHAS